MSCLFYFIRYERAQERGKSRTKSEAALALLKLSKGNEPEFVATPLPFIEEEYEPEAEDQENYYQKTVSESQVDSELQRLISENMLLKEELSDVKLNESSFANNDDKVKYFTGLPNFYILMTVFSVVKEHLPIPRGNADLGQFERLIMTLVRLKLNFPIQYLAYRFNSSSSTVSRTFLIVLHILYLRFKHLLYWPEREELRRSMPMDFQKTFGKKVSVIIDCFEVFIQRPKNLLARASTWSSYKHNNTVKFLIGISPQGTISFLSKAWGGRSSDKFITENCGILTKLIPGDLVLADRGFDIADSVGMRCAQVNIPAFTKGKAQLFAVDTELTRKIAHVRIHVIGLVRNKYTMLQDKLPVDFLLNADGLPVVDKITTVACALTNLCDSVVPLN